MSTGSSGAEYFGFYVFAASSGREGGLQVVMSFTLTSHAPRSGVQLERTREGWLYLGQNRGLLAWALGSPIFSRALD